MGFGGVLYVNQINQERTRIMNFYEVIVRLLNGSRVIGRTCVHVRASSPFHAAVTAEKSIDSSYHDSLSSHAVRITPIAPDEYLAELAA